ncbi:MAG: DnaA/Hda family protein, partial [Chloroflexota bacterium]
MDAKQVWRAVLGELQVSLSPANFETWLKDTSLVDLDENRYRIAAPNGFARDWLDNRYRTLISQTLARVVGGSVQVEFVVADAPGPVPSQVDDEAVPLPPASAGGNSVNISVRYNFSNFIVGSANRLAHAAALSVAERPGHAYNPLFLYGGVGLGKTHLMHAIGNAVAVKFPRKRILYATSEKFTNDFIN